MASRSTPLNQALQKQPEKPRTTPLDVFDRARTLWLSGERLNLGSLAEELGVSRATLFRWVGNKELLLGEILWSSYQPLVDKALSQAEGKGVDFMENDHHWHGVAPNDEQLKKALAQLPETLGDY